MFILLYVQKTTVWLRLSISHINTFSEYTFHRPFGVAGVLQPIWIGKTWRNDTVAMVQWGTDGKYSQRRHGRGGMRELILT